jgi:UPF0755 protein
MSNFSQKVRMIKKPVFYVLIVLVLVFGYVLFLFFFPNFSSKNNEKAYLRIPVNSTFNQVLDSLEANANIFSTTTFKQAAAIFRYSEKIKSGRYEIKQGMNNFTLIRKLRSGNQTPVRLTFNNIRTKEQLAKRLSMQIMADSASIMALMNDTAYLSQFKLNPNTVIAAFIPDTYEVFWDLDANELFQRIWKEYNKFWTDERKAKASEIPLTPVEVATLASIVEEETNGQNERSMVAGLYINRLKKDMPLQADPTLKFALGDFSIKRLTIQHILKISPYNTYRNHGLPPGPIRVASKGGINAVLNYTHHDYIYMCAKETFNGEHNFSATYAEHMINARKYQQALDERNIH